MIPKTTTIWRKRNRRGVLWLLAVVICSHLLIGILLEQWLTDVRDPEYAVRESKLLDRLQEHPDRDLVLFLGSSRVAYGFHGEKESLVNDTHRIYFNFGIPAAGPLMHLVTWDRLKKRGIRPKLLLIELVPAFVNGIAGEPREQRLMDTARLNAQELARVQTYSTRPLRTMQRWGIARLAPTYRHQAELRDTLGIDIYQDWAKPFDEAAAIDWYGWQPRYNPQYVEQSNELLKLAHSQYDALYQSFELAEKPAQAVRDLCQMIQSESIPFKIVLMPESSDFRKLYTKDAVVEFQQFLATLPYSVIDARDWVPDVGFYDGHHLLPNGASVFSDLLVSYLHQRDFKRN